MPTETGEQQLTPIQEDKIRETIASALAGVASQIEHLIRHSDLQSVSNVISQEVSNAIRKREADMTQDQPIPSAPNDGREEGYVSPIRREIAVEFGMTVEDVTTEFMQKLARESEAKQALQRTRDGQPLPTVDEALAAAKRRIAGKFGTNKHS
jgi:triphosphoribosyl-dephospho-CoA synthetase